jgi:hypothetical protein
MGIERGVERESIMGRAREWEVGRRGRVYGKREGGARESKGESERI